MKVVKLLKPMIQFLIQLLRLSMGSFALSFFFNLSLSGNSNLWAGEALGLSEALGLPKESIQHFPEAAECRTCHSHRGSSVLKGLHLLEGGELNHEEIPRLCGQCHGLQMRDWEKSIHGRRSGSWMGHSSENLHNLASPNSPSARREICTACHDPHNPKFKKMKAVPPPDFPKLGIKKEHSEGQSHGR